MVVRLSVACIASLAFLSACGASNAVVDKPSDISLSNALQSTIQAIVDARSVAYHERAKNSGIPIGLNVCSVMATFNIAASGTDTRNLNASVGTAKELYVSSVITGGVSSTATASRGNQIVVLLTSPACNPTGTLGTTAPSQVVLLERELEAAREGDPDPIKHPKGFLRIIQPHKPSSASNIAGGNVDQGNVSQAQEVGDESSLNNMAQWRVEEMKEVKNADPPTANNSSDKSRSNSMGNGMNSDSQSRTSNHAAGNCGPQFECGGGGGGSNGGGGGPQFYKPPHS